jgi:hypothetical protein
VVYDPQAQSGLAQFSGYSLDLLTEAGVSEITLELTHLRDNNSTEGLNLWIFLCEAIRIGERLPFREQPDSTGISVLIGPRVVHFVHGLQET